jgi:hypothetical protein
MVAPLRQTKATKPSPAMQRAYQLVAATLLKRQLRPAETTPPVSAWKAWTFTIWVTAATVIYLAYWLGLR